MEPTFPNRLRQRRRELEHSQERAAEKMSVSHNTVNRWEQGHNVPNFMMRKRVAEYLGMSPEDLDTLLTGEKTDAAS